MSYRGMLVALLLILRFRGSAGLTRWQVWSQRRKLSKPVQPKQPLDLETVVRIAHCSYSTASASFADIRFLLTRGCVLA